MTNDDPSVVAVVEYAADVPKKGKAGRPAGSTGRPHATIRFMLEQLVSGQTANLDQALRDILNGRPELLDAGTGRVLLRSIAPNPMGFTAALTGLLDFALPRLSRVEVKDDRATLESVEISATATPEEAQAAYLRLTQG